MRVEIVEETGSQAPVPMFPPENDHLDLRANPQAVEQIAAARKYLPLRNFLSSLNGEESVFATASASTKSDSPAAVCVGLAHEFASQTTIVFAEPSLNWDREHYADLAAGLQKLLERDASDAVHAVLRISPCDFAQETRRGFCLSIRLVAGGESAEQAELRWGLGLARLQQALLFRSRVLKQTIAV